MKNGNRHTYAELTECEKACIYVQGVISEMWKRHEVVTSGTLDEQGFEYFNRLMADGYAPSHDQQKQILETMLDYGYIKGFSTGAGLAYAEKFWPGVMKKLSQGNHGTN